VTQVVEVRGLRELREALLRKIPENMQGKVLQKALSAGTAPVVRDARQRAPVKSGVLKRAIHAMRSKLNSNGIFEERIVRVRHGKKQQKNNRDAFYWRFIEFGRGRVVAGSRFRRTKLGKLRNYGTDAQVLGTPEKGFFGKSVDPAGERPFLRPAFDANKFKSLNLITEQLRKSLEVAARKARWQTPSR
jgi:HK97 gp10 family phage protein